MLPSTLNEWAGLLVSLTALVGVIYSAHRFALRSTHGSIAKLAASVNTRTDELQQHFDEEIVEAKSHFDRELVRLDKTHTAELNHFRSAVDTQLNGWSGRIVDQGRRIESVEETQMVQERLLAASIEDRRHLNAALGAINSRLDDANRDRREMEARLMTAITRPLPADR